MEWTDHYIFSRLEQMKMKKMFSSVVRIILICAYPFDSTETVLSAFMAECHWRV
jgi:hypothetical protein